MALPSRDSVDSHELAVWQTEFVDQEMTGQESQNLSTEHRVTDGLQGFSDRLRVETIFFIEY